MLIRALLSCGFVLAASAVLAQTFPAGPKVEVKAITQPAPTLPQYTKVDIPLLRDAVASASNGRVEVKLASWPEMNVNGPEVLRLVRAGQVDIGAAALTVVSGDVPLLDGTDLAGQAPDIATARKVGDALLPYANKELERLGVRMVAQYPFSAQVFWCRKPLKGLADFKGLRIRTNGPSAADFVRAHGAQPVAVTFPEVYTALDRGTVDCAMTGSGSGNGVKWYEVSTHLYTLPLAWSTAGYFVNLAWWNKLDPAVRGLLEKALAQVEEAQWKLGADATQDGIDCNIGRASGCKMHTLVTNKPMTEVAPPPAETAELKKTLAETVLPGWVKRCGARCGEIYNQAVAPISGVTYRGN